MISFGFSARYWSQIEVGLYRTAFSVAPGAATSRFQHNVHRKSTRDLFGVILAMCRLMSRRLRVPPLSDGHVNTRIVVVTIRASACEAVNRISGTEKNTEPLTRT
jgi:hypothetical protein